MRIVVGPFRYTSYGPHPALSRWQGPPRGRHTLTLQPARGGPPPSLGDLRGLGLWFLNDDTQPIPTEWTVLSDDPLSRLSTASKRLVSEAFGAPTQTGNLSLIETLHRVQTQHGAMDGSTAAPRIANSQGRIRWKIIQAGRVLVLHDVLVGPGMPEWPGVLAVEQASYRRLYHRQAGTLHRRFLGGLARKYRLTYAEAMVAFIPTDLPQEEPLRPTTQYTEGFPGTSATLGGDNTWSEDSNDWQNFGGRGRYNTGSASGYAQLAADLSTDDVQIDLTITNEDSAQYNFGGQVGRYHIASGMNGYHLNGYRNDNTLAIDEYSADSSTGLDSDDLAGSQSLPSTARLTCNGNEIDGEEPVATARVSATDSTHSGDLRGGLRWFQVVSQDTRFDDFDIQDLAVEVIPVLPLPEYNPTHHRTAAPGGFVPPNRVN